MSRRIACSQCGAPHRLSSVETRYRCDYCRAWIELSAQASYEVWQLGAVPSSAEVQAAARRWMSEQEIQGARLLVEAPQWASHWQIFSDAGEEFRADASRWTHPLLAQLSLPAGPRIEASDPLPEPRISRADAERAALATFRAADASLTHVRLVHQPLTPVVIEFADARVAALFSAADERLLVATLPESARRRSVNIGLVGAYVTFTLLCLVLGLALAQPALRLLVLSLVFAAGSLGWPLLRREARR